MTATLHFGEEENAHDALLETLMAVHGDVEAVHGSYPAVAEIDLKNGDLLWTVSTEGSEWVLTGDGKTIQSGALDDPVAALAEAVRGSQVAQIVVPDRSLDLVIEFSDGKRLLVEAKAPNRRGPQIPFWEVLTPHGTVVSAGPGRYWAEYSADLAEDRLPWSGVRGQRLKGESRRFNAWPDHLLDTSVFGVRLVLMVVLVITAVVLAILGVAQGGGSTLSNVSQLVLAIAVLAGLTAAAVRR